LSAGAVALDDAVLEAGGDEMALDAAGSSVGLPPGTMSAGKAILEQSGKQQAGNEKETEAEQTHSMSPKPSSNIS